MPLVPLPADLRAEFQLADPAGALRRAQFVISPAVHCSRWPEAADPAWSSVAPGPIVVAVNVEGPAPEEQR